MTFPIYDNAQDIYNLDWTNSGHLQDVPVQAGVYALVNKFTGEWEYIGQASRIRYRLSSAMHPVYSAELHIIKYIVIEDKDIRRYTEYRAIEFLHPSMNHRNGFYPTGNKESADRNYDLIFNQGL